MASSPDSNHAQLDDSPAGARTPTNVHSAFASTELSPPGSQPQQRASAGLGVGVGGGRGPSGGRIAPDQNSSVKQQPGASWMNKRAEEEYQRAWEYVVDKDFSLSEC